MTLSLSPGPSLCDTCVCGARRLAPEQHFVQVYFRIGVIFLDQWHFAPRPWCLSPPGWRRFLTRRLGPSPCWPASPCSTSTCPPGSWSSPEGRSENKNLGSRFRVANNSVYYLWMELGVLIVNCSVVEKVKEKVSVGTSFVSHLKESSIQFDFQTQISPKCWLFCRVWLPLYAAETPHYIVRWGENPIMCHI